MTRTLDRRTLLALLASGATGGISTLSLAQSSRTQRFKAIAFDAFPIFDPRPITQLCDQLYPGRGVELANVWRTRQFEYQWLRALGGRYANFWDATRDALVFAAESLKLALSQTQRDTL